MITVKDEMVSRFLAWKLPENFNPDGGITFEPIGSKGTTAEFKREPSGTNLFDFKQAKAMLEHVLENEIPQVKVATGERLDEVIKLREGLTVKVFVSYFSNRFDGTTGWGWSVLDTDKEPQDENDIHAMETSIKQADPAILVAAIQNWKVMGA